MYHGFADSTHRMFVPLLINFLWQGTLAVVLVWAVLKLARIHSSTTRYFAWYVTLVSVAMLPLFSILLTALTSHGEEVVSAESTQVADASSANLDYMRVPIDPEREKRWYHKAFLFEVPFHDDAGFTSHGYKDGPHYISGVSSAAEDSRKDTDRRGTTQSGSSSLSPGRRVGIIAISVWAVVFAAMLIRLLVSQIIVWRIRARSAPLGEEWAARIAGELESAGLSREINVLACKDAVIPFSIGVLHPTVVLPGSLLDGSNPGDVRAILIHEATHVRRRDPLSKIIQYVISSMFFFFPPVWYAGKQLNRFREEICDEAVVRSTGNPLGYANCLVRVAERLRDKPLHGVVGIGIGEYRSRLLRRVEDIVNHRLRPATPLGKLKIALVLGGALLFIPLMCLAGRAFMSTENVSATKLEPVTPVWKPANGPWGIRRAVSLAVHPTEPRTILVGSCGMFRSEDGGDTWTRPDIEPAYLHKGSVGAIAFSPANPDRVYARVNNSMIVSDDAGKSWKEVLFSRADFLGVAGMLVADPFDEQRIYIVNEWCGCEREGKKYKKLLFSEDGGRTAKAILMPVSSGNTLEVERLMCDPDIPGCLYVQFGTSSSTSAVAVSTDHGMTWEAWDLGLQLREASSDFKFDPVSGDLYMLAIWPRMHTWYVRRLDRETGTWVDLPDDWENAPEEWPHDDGWRYGIKPASANGTVDFLVWRYVYAGPLGSGIAYYNNPRDIPMRTFDGGETWIPISKGLPFYFDALMEVHPSLPGVALVGTFITRDYGQTWEEIAPPDIEQVGMCKFHPYKPGTLFLNESKTKLIYRSDDWGKTWREISVFGWGIIFDRTDPDRYGVLRRTSREDSIVETTDDGATWTAKAIPSVFDEPVFHKNGIKEDMALQLTRDGRGRLLVCGGESKTFNYRNALKPHECSPEYVCVSERDGRRRLAILECDMLSVSSDGGERWTSWNRDGLPDHIVSMSFDESEDTLLLGMEDGTVLGFEWKSGKYKSLGDRPHIFSVMSLASSNDGGSYWMTTHGGGVWILKLDDTAEISTARRSVLLWSGSVDFLTVEERKTGYEKVLETLSGSQSEFEEIKGVLAEDCSAFN